MISAMKIATTEWAHSRLSRNPAERNIPDVLTLTRGWGWLQDQADEHTNQITKTNKRGDWRMTGEAEEEDERESRRETGGERVTRMGSGVSVFLSIFYFFLTFFLRGRDGEGRGGAGNGGDEDSNRRIGNGIVRVGGRTEWEEAFPLYFPL
jgi:hypothetical protein